MPSLLKFKPRIRTDRANAKPFTASQPRDITEYVEKHGHSGKSNNVTVVERTFFSTQKT